MFRAVSYMILSGICFFVVNFFVKILSSNQQFWGLKLQQYPIHELVFFRSLISFSISASIILYRGIPFFGVNKPWLLLRGMSGMIALTLFFGTISQLPLAIASTLQYLSPIFTVFISKWFFSETIKKHHLYSSLLALLGVLLISWSSFDPNVKNISIIWVLLGILSSIFSGLAYTSISRLKETDQAINIVLYFPMLALPFMGIWTIFDGIWPHGIEWLFLFILGVFTQIAQISLTRALMFGTASSVVPFQYLGAIYALVSGWFLFHEQLSGNALIGMSIIIVGLILIVGIDVRKKQTK